jgi:hypothetical protein
MPGYEGSDTTSTPADRAGSAPRDPSYPDRPRVDSDVRALLRQPSTPWIVFDRDSRVAAGEMAVPEVVLSSFRRSIVASSEVAEAQLAQPAQPAQPMFPTEDPAAIAEAASSARAEPSSLIVSSDIEIDVDPTDLRDALEAPFAARRPRGLAWAAAAAGVLAVVAATIGVQAGASHRDAQASAAAEAARTETAAGAAQAARAASAAALPSTAVTAPATGAARSNEAATPAAKPGDSSREALSTAAATSKRARTSRYGHLAIRGDAVRTTVWLDGKRLLGRGARAFSVACGDHTIAVGHKAAARAVEIPCGGRLVVGE